MYIALRNGRMNRRRLKRKSKFYDSFVFVIILTILSDNMIMYRIFGVKL